MGTWCSILVFFYLDSNDVSDRKSEQMCNKVGTEDYEVKTKNQDFCDSNFNHFSVGLCPSLCAVGQSGTELKVKKQRLYKI